MKRLKSPATMRRSTALGLTGEEALGLAVAIVAHAALIAALTLSPLGRHAEPPPQRMTVTSFAVGFPMCRKCRFPSSGVVNSGGSSPTF